MTKLQTNTIPSGITGFLAGSLQMGIMLPLRTINKFQYKYNLSILKCCEILYNSGKTRRFYYGFTPAVIDGGLCKSLDIYIYKKINNEYPNYNYIEKSIMIALYSSLFKVSLTP